MVQVKFKKLNPNAIPFKYIRTNDACMDIYCLDKFRLIPLETKIVSTGIALEIPEGYEGIVRGRSGLSAEGLLVHTGTIESEYRGDIGVIITNTSNKVQLIQAGSRIAQFTIKPVVQIDLIETIELTPTERGTAGYGSSGLK